MTELQPVQTWVRGLSVFNPRFRVVGPSWSLDIVLSALKRPPYFQLDAILMKNICVSTRDCFHSQGLLTPLRFNLLTKKPAEVISYVKDCVLAEGTHGLAL